MHSDFWEKIRKPIIGLAPMDGVTDAAFRQIVVKHGKPDIIFTEFTTVEGLAHGAIKPLKAFEYEKNEHPIIAQIFGTNLEAYYSSCFVICELGFDGIDINMGCPSKSVFAHGAGAKLISTPELAQKIIKQCQKAATDWLEGASLEDANVHPRIIEYIKTSPKIHAKPKRKLLPISVKTRTGLDEHITEEWISALLDAEPDNISLHGRTFKQMYSGEADWKEIAKAAKLIKKLRPATTILGNGDVSSHKDALAKIKKYKVDGVLIGRGCFGNPWVFQKYDASIKEKLETAIEHCEIYEKINGIRPKSFAPLKKHLGWYCKGFDGAKETRMELMQANSANDVKTIVKSILSGLPS
jgi:nifR3 family TIM-barrel protein